MDCEKLIELVRDHPVLFDTKNADYLRTKMKDELWEEIGAELASDGKAVKEHWRKLRECHREAMRRQKKKKGGEQGKRQKPWTYQSQMEFLLPYMKNRSTQSNLQNSSITVEEEAPNAATDEEIPLSPSNEESTLGRRVENEVPTKKSKIRSEPLFQQFIQSSERRNKHRDEQGQQLLYMEPQQSQHENDALYNFFLSMYATTKELSPRLQRQVRRKVFDAVMQAEEQNEYDETSQP